jgi:hypothetical protein
MSLIYNKNTLNIFFKAFNNTSAKTKMFTLLMYFRTKSTKHIFKNAIQHVLIFGLQDKVIKLWAYFLIFCRSRFLGTLTSNNNAYKLSSVYKHKHSKLKQTPHATLVMKEAIP